MDVLAESSVMMALYDWAVPMFAAGAAGLAYCILRGLWLAIRNEQEATE